MDFGSTITLFDIPFEECLICGIHTQTYEFVACSIEKGYFKLCRSCESRLMNIYRKKCQRCGVIKDIAEFEREYFSHHGCFQNCRDCRGSVKISDRKKCSSCLMFKLYEDFAAKPFNKDGYSYNCRNCVEYGPPEKKRKEPESVTYDTDDEDITFSDLFE